MKKDNPYYFLVVFILGLSACGSLEEKPSPSLANEPTNAEAKVQQVPAPVFASPVVPEPEPVVEESLHTVVASGVPARELLFALTRDAELNLDIDEDVNGLVTINAVEQPFSMILDRIARSVNLRYEMKNNVLRVSKDKPFLRTYSVDYLNMTRTSSGTVSVSTQLASTGSGADGSGGSGSNGSETSLVSETTNEFWSTLESNIKGILTDSSTLTTSPESGEGEASSSTSSLVNINKEAGFISVRATASQHIDINQYLNQITSSAQRQVLIEATIAEVTLNETYQAGIDWSVLQQTSDGSISLNQTLTNVELSASNSFSLGLSDYNFLGESLDLTLRALETFGDVSIMSSPKVMALNNQTALLKVVDNYVYFTISVDVDEGDEETERTVTYESELNTIPIGFVMTVTPFINEQGAVTLNVRPTISRVVGTVDDPNPDLKREGVVNSIPVVQVREVESVLKVNSGEVAVIGGLMQDEISENTNAVPFLGKVPLLGSLFRYQDNTSSKTELVIFLKPVVINHASLDGDLQSFKSYFPISER